MYVFDSVQRVASTHSMVSHTLFLFRVDSVVSGGEQAEQSGRYSSGPYQGGPK